MKTSETPSLNFFDRMALAIDVGFFGGLWRFLFGCALVPVFRHLLSQGHSGLFIVGLFGACLLALRIGPLLCRKVLPFSVAAKSIWAQRRELAKRYDSFQWRKLLWMGLGLCTYFISSQNVPIIVTTLTVFLVVAGGLGLAFWLKIPAEKRVV